ncbi:MAG: hypothetical protein K2X66_00220 [Cyanobacteria bacterium]|nr:hypothetical protein [Cyanobacteriota bacterium]
MNVSPLRFGAVYQVNSQTAEKPAKTIELENQANLFLSSGPFEAIEWFPPPAEGGRNVKQWWTFTDEDALAVAKNAGANVSITQSIPENQAAINAFQLANPSTLTTTGLGFTMSNYIQQNGARLFRLREQ